MSETVTNELMYELMKRMNDRLVRLEAGLQRVEGRLGSFDAFSVGLLQTDTRHEADLVAIRDRLDRIEQRLDLRD
ncbi:MAG: hypothetical protein AAGH41_15100 [Pseudomonadota bacterium]